MESVVDAIQGEKGSVSGMVAVDDPRDERVIVFIGHEIGFAPDRQGMTAEGFPCCTQVLVCELAEKG